MTQTMTLGTLVRLPSDKQMKGLALLCAALLSLPVMMRFCGDDGGTSGPGDPRDAGVADSAVADAFVADAFVADAGDDDAGVAPSCAKNGDPAVCFVSPHDNDEVTSPVHVELASDAFPIEPANGNDSVHEGHFIIVVDDDCGGVHRIVPDATHLDLSNGEHEALLDLAPGTHRLCVQAATGSHYTIDHLVERIEILVR